MRDCRGIQLNNCDLVIKPDKGTSVPVFSVGIFIEGNLLHEPYISLTMTEEEYNRKVNYIKECKYNNSCDIFYGLKLHKDCKAGNVLKLTPLTNAEQVMRTLMLITIVAEEKRKKSMAPIIEIAKQELIRMGILV